MTATTRAQTSTTRRQRPATRLIITRVVVFALFWVILTEGDPGYWGLAIIIILTSAAASLFFVPDTIGPWSITGILRFIPFFLKNSVSGGFDVAKRALLPGNRVDPELMGFDLSLRDEGARVFLSDITSLMPGALSVDLNGHRLTVHALDKSLHVEDEVWELQRHIARITGDDAILDSGCRSERPGEGSH